MGYGSRLYHQTFVFVTYGQTPLRQHTIIQIEKQKPLTMKFFQREIWNSEFPIIPLPQKTNVLRVQEN